MLGSWSMFKQMLHCHTHCFYCSVGVQWQIHSWHFRPFSLGKPAYLTFVFALLQVSIDCWLIVLQQKLKMFLREWYDHDSTGLITNPTLNNILRLKLWYLFNFYMFCDFKNAGPVYRSYFARANPPQQNHYIWPRLWQWHLQLQLCVACDR